jgi:putative endonuclease
VNQKTKEYFVYVLANKRGVLYVGVTNNLKRRVYEHKQKIVGGFTKRCNITNSVYFESTSDVVSAITREKQIKGLLRSKKIQLIKRMNPRLNDLSESWFENDEE